MANKENLMRKFRWLGLAILLVSAAILTALMFSRYERLVPTGSHSIATARYTYTDEHRVEQFARNGAHRKINVAFWYPGDADNLKIYPLIIFSHGGFGTETSNESLYAELASHGYVVCAINHPYHSFSAKFEDGTTAWLSMEYLGELQREDPRTDKYQSYALYQKWLSLRTGDISFVIDTILAKAEAGAGGVYHLINREKIGVMGHSLGGSAALAIPRQRKDIAAVIALESPFLYDIIGVDNGKFVWIDAAYPVPVLNIYSDSSWSHLADWSQYARNAALLSAVQEHVVNLHLPGAGHFSLTDLALASPLLTNLLEGGSPTVDRGEYLRQVNQACLDFFNRYLKNPDQNIEIKQ